MMSSSAKQAPPHSSGGTLGVGLSEMGHNHSATRTRTSFVNEEDKDEDQGDEYDEKLTANPLKNQRKDKSANQASDANRSQHLQQSHTNLWNG